MYMPFDLSLLLPTLLITLAATGVGRALGMGRRGELVAGFGVGLGILAALFALLGFPPFPPIAAGHKTFYLIAVALVLGLVIDLLKGREDLRRVSAMALPMMAAYWQAYAQFLGDFFSLAVLQFCLITVAGGAAMVQLEKQMQEGLAAPVMMTMVAIGLGGVALIGNEPVVLLIALATAASVSGFVVWNWPVRRLPVSGPLLLASGAALSGAAGQLAYFSPAPSWPLLLLLPIFFADRVCGKFIRGNDRIAELLRTPVLALLCVVPVSAAILAAWLFS
jgi:hypothetical protein